MEGGSQWQVGLGYRDRGGALNWGHTAKRSRFDIDWADTDIGDTVNTPKYGQSSTFSVDTRQKNKNMAGGAITVSRVRRRTGRVKRRSAKQVFKSVIGTGDEVIYRWQQTSRTYMGPGQLFLGSKIRTPEWRWVPIHFMSLTMHDKGDTNVAKGCFNSCMNRVAYNAANGQFSWENNLVSQQFDGTNAGNTRYQYEVDNTAVGVGQQWSRRIFHKYTDMKINLYGTYTVPIHYTIYLCTMKEQVDPLQFLPYGSGAIDEGTECANMLKDWTRKLMHNSVATNNKPTWPSDVKIIKSYKTTIQPLSYGDQNDRTLLPAGYSSTPHVRELRWFIRHDRFRDYKWSRNADKTNESRDFNAPGWDYVAQGTTMCDVEWGKRLYVVIMASSPEIASTADSPYMTTVDAITQGSYDICVRNSFMYMT